MYKSVFVSSVEKYSIDEFLEMCDLDVNNKHHHKQILKFVSEYFTYSGDFYTLDKLIPCVKDKEWLWAENNIFFSEPIFTRDNVINVFDELFKNKNTLDKFNEYTLQDSKHFDTFEVEVNKFIKNNKSNKEEIDFSKKALSFMKDVLASF